VLARRGPPAWRHALPGGVNGFLIGLGAFGLFVAYDKFVATKDNKAHH
jgi:hypothetical protein